MAYSTSPLIIFNFFNDFGSTEQMVQETNRELAPLFDVYDIEREQLIHHQQEIDHHKLSPVQEHESSPVQEYESSPVHNHGLLVQHKLSVQ